MLSQNPRRFVYTVTEYTNKLTSLLKSYYPQSLELAECLYNKISCDFLSTYPTVELLNTAYPSQLLTFYLKHSSVRREAIYKPLNRLSKIQPLTTDEVIVETSETISSAVVEQLRCLNAAIH